MSVKKAADLVAEAKGQIDNLTPEQVAHEVQNGAVLVDIRDGMEREPGVERVHPRRGACLARVAQVPRRSVEAGDPALRLGRTLGARGEDPQGDGLHRRRAP